MEGIFGKAMFELVPGGQVGGSCVVSWEKNAKGKGTINSKIPATLGKWRNTKKASVSGAW